MYLSSVGGDALKASVDRSAPSQSSSSRPENYLEEPYQPDLATAILKGMPGLASGPAPTAAPAILWNKIEAAPQSFSQALKNQIVHAQAAAAKGAASSSVPFDNLIISAAQRYHVDPTLVRAVIKAESGFNPRAVSSVGAKGLMQLMDGTAHGLGVHNSFDPAQNIDGGVKFLSGLLHKFGDQVPLALAAYNAGPGAVEQYRGIPPYKETQIYVQRVLSYQKDLAEMGGNV